MTPRFSYALPFVFAAMAVGALAALAPTYGFALVFLLTLALLTVIFWDRITPEFGLSVCVIVAVLGEQLTFAIGEEARALPVGSLVIIYVAALLTLRMGGDRVAGYLVSNGLPVFAWALVGVGLIGAGLVAGFPIHTIAGVVPIIGALSALVVGIIAVLSRADVTSVIRRSLTPLLWIAAAIGLIQFLHHAGIQLPGSHELVSYMESRAAELGRTLIYGRAVGVYTNPNTFALLGGIGLLIALAGHQPRVVDRAMTAIPAIAIIAMSQSRATIIAAALALSLHFAREHLFSSSSRIPVLRGFIVLGIPLFIVWAGTAQFAPAVLDALTVRVSQLLDMGAAGGPIDPSLVGRLGFWEAGLSFFTEHPLGTLGPPQMVVGTGIDSEYLFSLLQGGIVYLAALVWVITASITNSMRSESPLPLALPLYVALVGVSQIVSLAIPTVLFWAILGAALGHNRCTANPSSSSLNASHLSRQ